MTGRVRLLSWILWCCLAFIVAAIVVLSVLMGRKTRQGPPPEDALEKPVAVRTAVLEPEDVTDVIVLPGRVEPHVAVTLAVEKGGRIVELNADKGDSVSEGDVLLRLDDRIWQALLRRAKIESREAEKDYVRWQELKRTGAVSGSEFDAVQRRRDLVVVAVEEAETHVSQCTVSSPIVGVVNDRFVEEGEYVSEGIPVFEVVDVSRVKVAVDVPERDVFAVRNGSELHFDVEAHPGQVFTGTVSFLSVLASQESQSFRVELDAPNPGHKLRPGMIVGVSLIRGALSGARIVPLSAVVPKRGEHVVYVVKDRRAVRRVVRIERLTGHDAVISRGVEVGDEIVVEGQRALQDGMLVTVMNRGM